MRGIITITIDPPFVQFCPNSCSNLEAARYCQKDEVLRILSQLGAQTVPLKDSVVRLEGDFSAEMLLQWRLLPARFS